jgi:hypothetical protein
LDAGRLLYAVSDTIDLEAHSDGSSSVDQPSTVTGGAWLKNVTLNVHFDGYHSSPPLAGQNYGSLKVTGGLIIRRHVVVNYPQIDNCQELPTDTPFLILPGFSFRGAGSMPLRDPAGQIIADGHKIATQGGGCGPMRINYTSAGLTMTLLSHSRCESCLAPTRSARVLARR